MPVRRVWGRCVVIGAPWRITRAVKSGVATNRARRVESKAG